MKKIICFLLAMLMLVSVVACNTTDPNPADTTEAEATDAVSETEAETTTEATVPTGKVDAPAYTGVFKTGYDRQDVTPSGEIKMKDGRDLLLPAIKQCILDVDVEGRRMKVHVLDGLLDL